MARFFFFFFIYNTSQVPRLIEIGISRGIFGSYLGGHTQNPGAIPTSGTYIVNSTSCSLRCSPSRREPPP